jgi:hypothetical protein
LRFQILAVRRLVQIPTASTAPLAQKSSSDTALLPLPDTTIATFGGFTG